ncbi:MAG: hypothetical protein P8Y97_01465 [Candidatus Lokiarchaeota archaeon]
MVKYCPTCERNVIVSRKNIQHKYHELLLFMIILTCGIGFFIYLLLRYRMPKKFCPHCERDLSDFSQVEDNRDLIKNNVC